MITLSLARLCWTRQRKGGGTCNGYFQPFRMAGRVFEVEGGMVSVADGWQHGPQLDKGARWEPSEIGAAVRELLAKAPAPAPVYGAQ